MLTREIVRPKTAFSIFGVVPWVVTLYPGGVVEQDAALVLLVFGRPTRGPSVAS